MGRNRMNGVDAGGDQRVDTRIMPRPEGAGPRRLAGVTALAAALCFCTPLAAQTQGAGDDPVGIVPNDEDAGALVQARTYSPYAQRNFPTQVYWGDTHVHTDNSLDARGFGVTLDVEEAFRFARGEEVISSHGLPFKLRAPLDWLVVSDHSDGMGAMKQIFAGNPNLLRDQTVRGWYTGMTAGGEAAFAATMDVINAFSQGKTPEVILDKTFQQSVWDDYLEVAEAFNDPGTFTTLMGYEWTSTENGNNLHRNVIYRDGINRAQQMVPYTAAESFNPEDLWEWMAAYEDRTGGRVLAIAHNGNMSNGIMFPVETNPATQAPLTGDYAEMRARWEPLYEVTQIKGDGETHPMLSPNDEFADHETLELGNLNLTVPKEPEMLRYEYARQALRDGLKMEVDLGTNPYRFGMVGSSDTHTALAAVAEENYIGKHSGTEPSADRIDHPMAKFEGRQYEGWSMSASGYAAVWATENTRKALWDAMARKEVYATTGPRMTVRFFGGWGYSEADAQNRLPAEVGYAKGVPMGGDLPDRPDGAEAPTFLVGALRDPNSGNLDRIQIIKGWLDSGGETQERVYDVVCADGRGISADGRCDEPVGNTVNVANATWSNSIGEPEMLAVWQDPDFEPGESAFYYARVIEIPTPRWTAYDAKRFGLDVGSEVPMTIQERAYTSPIWYSPDAS